MKGNRMPKIIADTITPTPIDQITRHPDNPRRGNVQAITHSITANGFYAPIIVQRSSGHIIAGNHRYEAAIAAGMTEVPVAYIDVDDQTARRIMLADNKTADEATYDERVLADLLTILAAEDDLDGSGYSLADAEQIIAALDYPTDDEWALAAERMPDGDPEFQQMSFVLHVDQKKTVDRAIAKALAAGAHEPGMKNENGSALAYISAAFIGGA